MFAIFLIHFEQVNALFCLSYFFFGVRLFTLVSKSFFVTKFACADLALKISAVNLVNSGVVIYLL